LQSFSAFLNNAINERIIEIINYTAINNPRYKELTEQIKTAYNYILNNIQDPSKDAVDNLKDLLNMRDSLVMEVVYRQGLKDGIDVQFLFSK
jgi:hypothetical protein